MIDAIQAVGQKWSGSLGCLFSRGFSGNVAELRRIALQATHLAGQRPIQLAHLPTEIATQPQQTATNLVPAQIILPSDGIELEEVERVAYPLRADLTIHTTSGEQPNANIT